MFTGIIESIGYIKGINRVGSNVQFIVKSDISDELKVDQSVSHNGVCLTVTALSDGSYKVTAVDETLQKSNLGQLKEGEKINLERCMRINGRFDGHIVQGHVDQTAVCVDIKEADGSWIFDFEYDPSLKNTTVEKGSITVNGVSLTCFNTKTNGFSVAIIPFTYENTNFHQLKKGDEVNLEFDIIGKYVQKMLNNYI